MLKEKASYWFPMRIRNSSLSRLKDLMDNLGKESDIEDTYVPLHYIKVSQEKMDFAPFLMNYIFVRSTFKKLVNVKSSQSKYEPLRFVMHPNYNENYERHDEVLFMSDKRMEDYKRITAEENANVIFLDNMDYANKPSREVQITEGKFAGVIGRIKRIKGARCVVVPVGQEMAAAVVDVPNRQLRYLTDEEVKRIEEEERKRIEKEKKQKELEKKRKTKQRKY